VTIKFFRSDLIIKGRKDVPIAGSTFFSDHFIQVSALPREQVITSLG